MVEESESIARRNGRGHQGRQRLPLLRSVESMRGPPDAVEGVTGEDTAGQDSVPDGTVPDQTAALQLIGGELTACREQLKLFGTELQRIKNVDRVLAEIHDRYRALDEQHYEREIFKPIFLGLIAIADRCRDQVQRSKSAVERLGRDSDAEHKKAMQYVLKARAADYVEVENLLRQNGVEAFQHPGDRFDAAAQKCVRCVECKGTERTGRIAKRLLPGYRHNDKIVRAEYVMVYVNSSTGNTQEGGRK